MSYLADLQKVLAGESDKPPKSMRTSEQIQKEDASQKSISQVRADLAKLVKAGLWKRESYRIVLGGRLVPVPHYGPSKAK